MNKFALVSLGCLAISPAWAQYHRPATIGPVGQVGFGFGSVVFPGTGVPRPVPVPGHAANLGAAVRGVYAPPAAPGWGGGGRGGFGGGRGFGYGGSRGGGVVPVAVPVPVYVGGYGYGYGYEGYAPQQPQPAVTVVNAPPETPTVIINQNYTPDRVQPVMREYTTAPRAEPNNDGFSSYQAPVPNNPEPPRTSTKPVVSNRDDREDTPTVYLVALRDGTVYSAYAYWVEGDTLHYITTKHSHNRASLDLVDDALSAQLNAERKVEWKLKNSR